MERKIKILTITLFFCMIVSLGVATIIGGNKKYSEFEKRELQTFPQLSLNTIAEGVFQEKFNDYLNDQIIFRDKWVSLKTAANKSILQRESNGVYFGDDNYLIEKYEDSDFDKKNIKANVKYLSQFVNLASESMGTDKVKVVFIPSKVTALDKKLPAFATTSSMREYNQKRVLNKINNSSEIVLDLSSELKEHQDEYIYYKTDHHWTTLGAYYGYCAIQQFMEIDPMNRPEFETVSDDFLGTTYNKIHYASSKDVIEKPLVDEAKSCKVVYNISGDIEEADSLYDSEALKTEDKYNYFMGGNFSRIDIHTGCKNGKTLFLVKDSYANCMIPFFAHDYENIILVDLRYVNSSIFEILQDVEKIDALVLAFNEEKFMQDSHLYNLE